MHSWNMTACKPIVVDPQVESMNLYMEEICGLTPLQNDRSWSVVFYRNSHASIHFTLFSLLEYLLSTATESQQQNIVTKIQTCCRKEMTAVYAAESISKCVTY